MDLQEYKEKEKEKALEEEYNAKKSGLIRECVKANNPHKVGDIVSDHIGMIRIESIGAHRGGYNSLPTATYNGPILKQDGSERKNKEREERFGKVT
jgi:hypothetical protein